MKPMSLLAAAAAAMLALPMSLSAAEPMKPSTAGKLLIDDDPKEFVKAAGSSGMFEVEAARLALERSQDPQIRAYAERMIKDHTKANEELKALAKKKNLTVPTKMMTRHQMMYDELKDEQSAQAFDDAYTGAMVTSHMEAVTLFDEVADDAKDADIRSFAAKTLPTLQSHGGMAKDLDEAHEAAHGSGETGTSDRR